MSDSPTETGREEEQDDRQQEKRPSPPSPALSSLAGDSIPASPDHPDPFVFAVPETAGTGSSTASDAETSPFKRSADIVSQSGFSLIGIR